MDLKVNRKLGPAIKPINNIPLPAVQFYTLDNGIPVYEISAGTQDVVKIEVVYRGGRLLEDKKLSSRATAYLIKEETQSTTGAELAETIDFYGASLGSDYNMDSLTLHALFLGKHQDHILPKLAEIIHLPHFSLFELEKYKQRSINDLQVELTKNDVLAYRVFTEDLFGKDHIYGYNSSPEMYNALTPHDCDQYYRDYIGSDKCIIFCYGKITDKVRKLLNHELGQIKKDTFSKKYYPSKTSIIRQEKSIAGDGDYQDSVMIGRRLFQKDHMDYPGMVVLNTILGGYFGSRLMQSIREEHGYTYGISSLMDISRWDGCLYISTDVAPEYTSRTLEEIYLQIQILRESLVSTAELEMVKNYILGNILNMLDGPFKSAKWLKSLILNDLSLAHGASMIEKIRDVSRLDIQNLANKYLRKEHLQQLIVHI